MRLNDIDENILNEGPMGMLGREAKRRFKGTDIYQGIAGKLDKKAGEAQATDTALELIGYYRKQITKQEDPMDADSIKKFFAQYNVPEQVVTQALAQAGVTEGISEAPTQPDMFADDPMSGLRSGMNKAFNGNAPTDMNPEPAQQATQQTGSGPTLNNKQIQSIFKYVAKKHNFTSTQDKNTAVKIPADVIKAVQKLNDAQKDQLLKVLSGTKLV